MFKLTRGVGRCRRQNPRSRTDGRTELMRAVSWSNHAVIPQNRGAQRTYVRCFNFGEEEKIAFGRERKREEENSAWVAAAKVFFECEKKENLNCRHIFFLFISQYVYATFSIWRGESFTASYGKLREKSPRGRDKKVWQKLFYLFLAPMHAIKYFLSGPRLEKGE